MHQWSNKRQQHRQEQTGWQTDTLKLPVDQTTGNFNITINKTVWLENAPTFVKIAGKVYSTGDGSLQLISNTTTLGFDNLGSWASRSYYFKPKGLNVNISVSFKVYSDRPEFVILEQVPHSIYIC